MDETGQTFFSLVENPTPGSYLATADKENLVDVYEHSSVVENRVFANSDILKQLANMSLIIPFLTD